MRWVTGVLVAALLALGSSGCAERPKPAAGAHLEIAASSSSERLAQALIDLYLEAFPTASAHLTVSNSRMARDTVEQGKAQLALVSDPAAAEPAASPDARAGIESVPVARDGVAVIVAAGNPIRELSLAQVREVFQARVLTWREVGGAEADIQTLSREAGSGTRQEFEQAVMGGRDVTTLALVLPATGPAVEYVARHSNAIAYASTACLTAGVRALVIEGRQADADTIRSGQYPLTRLISVLRRSDADAAVQAFVDLAVSDAGQRAAEAAGYVGIR
jgi:phosphate transport system substrate-binding protein